MEVSVKLVDPEPGDGRLEGTKLAVKPVGRPPAENAIEDWKPPLTVTVSFRLAAAPGVTVSAVADALN